MENWLPIAGFDGKYEVSDMGNVRALDYRQTGKIVLLSLNVLYKGYPVVGLSKDGNIKNYRVHKLVTDTFWGKCPLGMTVNHKKGIKTDNRLSELEYIPSSDNTKHAWKTGLAKMYGENSPFHKLTMKAVYEIKEKHLGGIGYRTLAREYGVDRKTIKRIFTKNGWRRAIEAELTKTL